MSTIDYSLLRDPSIENTGSKTDTAIKNNELVYAKDIFEFILGEQFLNEYSLFPRQRKILETYYNTLNEQGYRIFQELIIISGMRSGKTRMAAWIGAYQLHKLIQGLEKYGDFSEFYRHEQGISIARGQRLYVVVVAAALDQAEATVFSQMRGLFNESPWFKKYIAILKNRKQYSADKYEMRFTDKLFLKAEDSNSSSLVGKTIHTLLFDEISRMDVSDSQVQKKSQKRAAGAVYQALSKGTTTFANDRNIIVVSAPMYEDDYGMQLLLQSGHLDAAEDTQDIIGTMAKKYPDKDKISARLGFHSSTFSFNPTVTVENQPFIQGIKNTQPMVFSRDYLALPPAGIDAYFEYPEKIDEAIRPQLRPFLSVRDYIFEEQITDSAGGKIIKPYVGKSLTGVGANPIYRYFVSCDPAGKKDSYTLCVGHGEWIEIIDKEGTVIRKLKTVIDFVTGWKPDKAKKVEVHIRNVEEFIAKLHNNIKITTLTFDHWNSLGTIQSLNGIGIPTKELPITLPLYDNLKQKFSLGLISLPASDTCPEIDILVSELKKLQIVKGNDVDHPANGSKDYADSVARVNWLVEQSAPVVYGGVDKQKEEAFIRHLGGSSAAHQETLRKIFPIVQRNSEIQSGNGFFVRGGSNFNH